jgi:hypothetical protein
MDYKPVMTVSVEADDDTRDAENRQFEIEFKAQYNAYMKCKQAL